ncbi:uncharacterized protein LOC133814711 [Humulus lupulus]|uniref:uncharacterized protein LOC133814711 n=1 Tax=Humulus lupulus TaxID=3486 RepID=UPI002B41102B|nr:uncharacterized protein LOC133814711 [Humulus lupulus]
MARRKKVHQKPATSDKGKVTPGNEKKEESLLAVDDEGPATDLEEVFKDSMAEFPEVGGSSRKDRMMDDDEIHDAGLKWSEQDDDEPLVQDGHRIAQVDLEEIVVEASIWNSAVVCVVLGANPPFAVFEGFIKRMWGNLGIEKIARLNASHTLVKFRDEVTRDLVLENGVLHFDRKPVIVRPWTTDLDHLRLVKSVPVWVRLPGLGLQYWGTKCLSALVSTLRRPILVDKVTKDRSMMQFSRALVEIDIADEILKSIQFMNEIGQLMEQLVEFEWLPTQCKNCKVFGHTMSLCNRKKEEVWKQKEPKAGEVKQGSSSETQKGITSVISEPVAGLGSKQVVDILENPIAHEKSAIVANVVTQISKPVQDKEHRSSSDNNAVQEEVWVTPKRVGGVKKLGHKVQNKLRNTYDVLQDKRVEGLKQDEKLAKKLNGGIPHS